MGLTMAALMAFYVVSCTERPRPRTAVEPGQSSIVTRVESKTHTARTDPEQIIVCPGDIELETLDPSLVVNSTVYEISQHIFDKLVTTDNNGKTIPDLAVEWNRIDSLTMQFKLRKGVKFHNGEPFDAEAVKFSIERLRASANWVFLKPIARVDIIDTYTVNVVSSAPDGLLLQRLSFLPFLVPPRSYDKKNFGRHPIGTGPYQFQHWGPGQIALVKNSQYWKPDIPKLDHLVFTFIANVGDHGRDQLDQLLAGRLDLLKQSPGTKTLDVQRSAQTTLIKRESARYVIMLLNPRRPPFSDLRMRQAVAHAIDKDLLIKLAVKGNGRKIPFLSSDMDFGHNAELKPYPFDLSQARALVKESGYSNGSNVVVLIRNESETLARVVAHFLKDIGIDIVYKTVSPEELAAARDGFDICIYPYHNPFMHATFQLNQFFQDPIIRSSASYPQGFDALYEKMIATLDPAEQAQLSYRLEKMAYDQYVIIPLFQKIETYGAAKDLVYSPSISGMLNLNEAYFK
jgi:peptide/nickel transport system substrate-binding protein